ncbi:MAG: VanW family protein [Limnochordia bacterium]|nr:VanW family protein [Limnochordia bacterium]
MSSRTVFTVITPREIRMFVLPLLIVVILGSFIQRVERLVYGVRPGVMLDGQPVGGLFAHEVRRIVERKAQVYNTPPVNAQIDKKTREIIPGEMGRMIDIDGTVRMVLEASPRESLSSVVSEIRPEITFEMLVMLDESLGVFHTTLMGSPGRMQNIRLCMEAINNTVVGPGETFSFNQVVGERTYEKGYRPAPVIVGSSVIDDIGGGVCQVSSTLYNAVRLAKLEIVERHLHGMSVTYIARGMDATVAWPDVDFKFRNNTTLPVIVSAVVAGGQVRVEIVGKRR